MLDTVVVAEAVVGDVDAEIVVGGDFVVVGYVVGYIVDVVDIVVGTGVIVQGHALGYFSAKEVVAVAGTAADVAVVGVALMTILD